MSHPSHKVAYRPEIDGLRAIAIVPVVLFHAGATWLPGGFLGVDIFFVISGFLITGILIRDLEKGNFSLARFYERRARRILPAMLTMLAITLLISGFFAWPWQVQELSESALFSLLFAANIYFENAVGYFRPDAESYPLLHMWSLAIEEQYYLAFPLVLLIFYCSRLFNRHLALWLSLLSFLSLALACANFERAPNEVFYLVQYRAWELGAGSVAAALVLRIGLIPEMISRYAAPFALAIIAGSILLIDASQGPIWRLPLVLSVSVLLSSAVERGPAALLLTTPVLRYIGLISFSLYLWHQPAFAFARLELGHLAPVAAAALVAVSFVLAHLSYRYIEQPFRNYETTRAVVFRRSALGIAGVVGLALLSYGVAPNLMPRNPLDRSLAVSMDQRATDVVRGYDELLWRTFPDNGKENVLLVGDSYSQDFLQMARHTGAFSEVNLLAHYMPGRCQPYWGEKDVSAFLAPASVSECEKRRRSERQYLSTVKDADIVILAAKWTPWAAEMIEEISDQFVAQGSEVIVIGRKSFSEDAPLHLRDYLGLSAHERQKVFAPVGPQAITTSRIMKRRASNFDYVDFTLNACQTSELVCPFFTEAGYPVSHDGKHLTAEGAAFFGPRLFTAEPLRNFVSDAPLEPASKPAEADGS